MTWGAPGRSCAGSNKARRGSDQASFLLGGNDGEFLLGEDPPNARNRAHSAVTSHEQKSATQPPSAVETHEQPRSRLTNEASGWSALGRFMEDITDTLGDHVADFSERYLRRAAWRIMM
jgi:hypothetical protein